MARYGLATILEDHPVGHEFSVGNLPLHLTHIDSFESQLQPDDLIAKLADLLSQQNAFVLKVLTDEYYGPEKDIPVTTLELTSELKNLHISLVDFLQREGATLRNPQFNGESFTPHISIYGSKRVIPGANVPINDISLAAKISDAEDANRRVLANFPLKQ